jgi:hypothetical protein
MAFAMSYAAHIHPDGGVIYLRRHRKRSDKGTDWELQDWWEFFLGNKILKDIWMREEPLC